MPDLTVALDVRLIGTHGTGDTTYWTGLLNGLCLIEPEIRLLLFSNVPQPTNIPIPTGAEWIHLPTKNSRMWSLLTFPLTARRLGAKAIHTQYTLSPLMGTRGITTIHDVSFFLGPEWFKPRDRLFLQTSIPSSVRRAAKVITVSETSKSEIERYIPESKGKIAVTPNALNPSIQPMPKHEAIRFVEDELNVQTPFLLSVGTRWPRKNMALAVRATELLPANLSHRLVLTGHSGWGDTSNASRTIATGYVGERHLSALYSAADLYLAPSRHEGFGLPLLESFACGCPVVCSSGGALPEVAGDAAFVEKSWEPEDWARTITDLLSDSSKLDSMREKGYERLSHFDWKVTAQKTLDVYREVAR